MDELVLSHLWMVKQCVFKCRGQFDDDLYQEGVIALIKLVEKYDPSQGEFARFAYKRVKGAIIDAMRREMRHLNRKTVFEPITHELTGVDDLAIHINLAPLFAQEKPRNAAIITRHLNGERLKDIGEEYGITESRCCQIYQRFLRRVRNEIEDNLDG